MTTADPDWASSVATQSTDEHMWIYLRSVVPDIDPDGPPKDCLLALPTAIDSRYVGVNQVHSDAPVSLAVTGLPSPGLTLRRGRTRLGICGRRRHPSTAWTATSRLRAR